MRVHRARIKYSPRTAPKIVNRHVLTNYTLNTGKLETEREAIRARVGAGRGDPTLPIDLSSGEISLSEGYPIWPSRVAPTPFWPCQVALSYLKIASSETLTGSILTITRVSFCFCSTG